MTKARELLEFLSGTSRPSDKDILRAFEELIIRFKLNVSVEEVSVDLQGGITVTFSDKFGDLLDLFFYWDQDSAFAVVQTDEDESTLFDLASCAPSCIDAGTSGKYVNLLDLSWVNKSTLVALLTQGLDADAAPQPPLKRYDAFGNIMPEAYVARGSRRMKMPIVSSLHRSKNPQHKAFNPEKTRKRVRKLNEVE